MARLIWVVALWIVPRTTRAQSLSLGSLGSLASTSTPCGARNGSLNDAMIGELQFGGTLAFASLRGWKNGSAAGSGAVAQVRLATPEWRGLRSGLRLTTGANDDRCLGMSRTQQGMASLTYSRGSSLYFIESGRTDNTPRVASGANDTLIANVRSARITSTVNLGTSHQFSRGRVAFTLGSRGQRGQENRVVSNVVQAVDSFYNDTTHTYTHYPTTHTTYDAKSVTVQHRSLDGELRIDWVVASRLSMRGTFGHSLGGVAPSLPTRWGEAEGMLGLTSHVAFVARFTAERLPTAFSPLARSYVTLGVQWASPHFSPRHATLDGAAVASAFRVRLDSGTIVLGVRAPDARVVELTGDFLGWEPLRMSRVAAGWWEARVNVAPGVHRVNVRVDGARWMVPQGLAARRDDFGSEAGVLIVP